MVHHDADTIKICEMNPGCGKNSNILVIVTQHRKRKRYFSSVTIVFIKQLKLNFSVLRKIKMVLNGHQLLLAWPFEEEHFIRFTPGPCFPG